MASSARLPLSLGIYVNNRAAVFLPDYPMARLLDMAVEVEQLGFDVVWVGESLTAKPRYSPIATLAAIAARTHRVRLGTAILQPLFRHPILLAQEWATLDQISDGRTILGAGLGAGAPGRLQQELTSLGIAKATRGRRFDEYLGVLKRLWSEPTVTHHGEFYTLDDVALGYHPVQQPHPPLWVAAGAYISRTPAFRRHGTVPEDKVGTFHGPFERAARLGDGWLASQPNPEDYATIWPRIQQLARDEYGRPPGSIHPALVLWVNVNEDKAVARREARAMLEAYHQVGFDEETIDRYVLHGPVAACLERLGQYAAAGVRSVVLVPASPDHPGQIRRVAERLLPHCTAEPMPAASAAPS